MGGKSVGEPHESGIQVSFSIGGRWLLYFHTIRNLKPSQIFWRVWRRLPVIAAPAVGPPPALRRSDRPFAAFPRKTPSLIGPDAFRFLHRDGQVRSAADWNDRRSDALWLYNLHYFDDLCAEGARARRGWHEALIARWIAENPVHQGAGWDAYPLSLRVVNWIKWLAGEDGARELRLALAPAATARGTVHALIPQPAARGSVAGWSLSEQAIHSLAVQARYLAPRVEWHLLNNHVLANAKALVFASCFFAGAEAEAWLKKGLAILREQLALQVLADGGHFERSPMYHAIELEDLLDLVNLSCSYPNALPTVDVRMLQETARRMLGWARVMRHPDGGIAFFNDAAFGVASMVAELEYYAARLGIDSPVDTGAPLACLAQSGYVRLKQDPFTVLFDAASVGPCHVPGHAHADTLAFELSCGAQRVLCNSGTSCYGRGETRQWERSTAAHNTVEIDGENSSEVWDGFRVARCAHPVGLQVAEDAGLLRVTCAHDGYARLRGRPQHRRTLELGRDGLIWIDEIFGGSVHTAIGRIPLHPSVAAQRIDDTAWRLELPGGARLRLAVEGAGVRLDAEAGRYSPEFGLTQERTVRPQGPRQILYAGNLGRVQQLDLLIRAVADLKKEGGLEGWVVRLVGDGALRQELTSQVKQLGLEGARCWSSRRCRVRRCSWSSARRISCI